MLQCGQASKRANKESDIKYYIDYDSVYMKAYISEKKNIYQWLLGRVKAQGGDISKSTEFFLDLMEMP